MKSIKEEDISREVGTTGGIFEPMKVWRELDTEKVLKILNEMREAIPEPKKKSAAQEFMETHPIKEPYVCSVPGCTCTNISLTRATLKEPSTDVGWEVEFDKKFFGIDDGHVTLYAQQIKDFITHQKEISFREGQESADVEGQKSVWVAQGVGIGKKEVIESVLAYGNTNLLPGNYGKLKDFLETLKN